jgi:hypothetical protein
MARLGVSITKSVSFRGTAQEFSNTYYYEGPEPLNETVAGNMIGLIVPKEKAIHGAAVTFVRAKAWSAGGTAGTNTMLAEQNLSGTGTAGASNSSMDKERAFLVRIRAGNDSKGRPVYLRKYWHLDVAALNAESITAAQLANITQLTTNQRNALVTAINDLKSLTPVGAGGAWTLVSDKGRNISGDTIAHQYLEHHQLGDMWR